MNSVVLNGIVYQCHISNDNCKYELISADGTVKSLTYPENHKHKIEDIVDVVVINDVPCYAYQNDEGQYSLRPALEGSGIAIDSYCYDINSWGKYGDFVKLACVACGHKWYFSVRQIPIGDKYEVACPVCGALFKKKRV